MNIYHHTGAHTNPKENALEELKIRSATSQRQIQRLELCCGQNRENVRSVPGLWTPKNLSC